MGLRYKAFRGLMTHFSACLYGPQGSVYMALKGLPYEVLE